MGRIEVTGHPDQCVAERSVSGQRPGVRGGNSMQDAPSSAPVHRCVLQFVRRPVGQREAVVAGQRLDLVMVVVDGLTTGLDVQPIGERRIQGVHPAADAITGFEHDHLPASGTKSERGGQPGKPSAYHDDPSPRRSFWAWL